MHYKNFLSVRVCQIRFPFIQRTEPFGVKMAKSPSRVASITFQLSRPGKRVWTTRHVTQSLQIGSSNVLIWISLRWFPGQGLFPFQPFLLYELLITRWLTSQKCDLRIVLPLSHSKSRFDNSFIELDVLLGKNLAMFVKAYYSRV
jgi:hypothetical protein